MVGGLGRGDRSWINPCSVRIDRGSIPVEQDRSLHRADRSPVERDRSLHRADRSPVEQDRSRASAVRIDRGRGPRSCGSIHAPCGSISVDPCITRIDCGSIPVEGLGRADGLIFETSM
ncbi:hypothetical protein ACJRO7_010566 [Eucalyptus globulus]|uniref:Uncharacterized protein n=1 Tax=Eucalyptus globulus TaxID=34317 RepID=A0ABD3LCC5_EUCGL